MGGRENVSDAHVRSLDGLRFFAFFSVFVFHALQGNAAATPVVRYGALGVQVFFVLSGFLIGGGLLAMREATHVPISNRLRTFYARRSLRIFPVYYLTLVVLVLLELVGVSEIGGTGLLPWNATYLTNVKFAMDEQLAGGLSHLWSLAVEEHFYLLAPLLVLCCSIRALSWIAVASCVVGAAGRVALDLGGSDFGWMLSPLQFDCMFIGIAAAIVYAKGSFLTISADRFQRLCTYAAAACVPLFLLWQVDDPAVGLINDALDNPILALAVAGLVLRLWRGTPGFLSRVLTVSPFPYLGTISYALYLFHLPLLVLAAAWLDMLPAGTAVPALIITVVLAAISWRLVEGPINAHKRRFPMPSAAPATAPATTQALD